MGAFDRPRALRELNAILSKARMSPRLRDAVEAIRAALNTNNLYLATELSVVKSYITGVLSWPASKDDGILSLFREDRSYNERVLGGLSVYSLLDDINFRLAMKLNQMPAGFAVLNMKTHVITTRHDIPASASAILADMSREEFAIRRAAAKRYS